MIGFDQFLYAIRFPILSLKLHAITKSKCENPHKDLIARSLRSYAYTKRSCHIKPTTKCHLSPRLCSRGGEWSECEEGKGYCRPVKHSKLKLAAILYSFIDPRDRMKDHIKIYSNIMSVCEVRLVACLKIASYDLSMRSKAKFELHNKPIEMGLFNCSIFMWIGVK